MSTYEYTDVDGSILKVNAFHGPRVGRQVYFRAGREGTYVKPEDAPAVALAILEAAGIKPARGEQARGNPERWASKAVEALTYSVKHRAKIAEREAEDAKIKGYRLRLLESSPETANHRSWSEIDDLQRDLWRRQYRAAREFFAREETIPAEVIEPRTVASSWDLGPEHRDAEWQDNTGCYWRSIDRTWKWRSRPDAAWRCSAPEAFPWTEVL